jgi:hypothetical protein
MPKLPLVDRRLDHRVKKKKNLNFFWVRYYSWSGRSHRHVCGAPSNTIPTNHLQLYYNVKKPNYNYITTAKNQLQLNYNSLAPFTILLQ